MNFSGVRSRMRMCIFWPLAAFRFRIVLRREKISQDLGKWKNESQKIYVNVNPPVLECVYSSAIESCPPKKN